jgi:hypothetical protein
MRDKRPTPMGWMIPVPFSELQMAPAISEDGGKSSNIHFRRSDP